MLVRTCVIAWMLASVSSAAAQAPVQHLVHPQAAPTEDEERVAFALLGLGAVGLSAGITAAYVAIGFALSEPAFGVGPDADRDVALEIAAIAGGAGAILLLIGMGLEVDVGQKRGGGHEETLRISLAPAGLALRF